MGCLDVVAVVTGKTREYVPFREMRLNLSKSKGHCMRNRIRRSRYTVSIIGGSIRVGYSIGPQGAVVCVVVWRGKGSGEGGCPVSHYAKRRLNLLMSRPAGGL
jgi:hypothetical protein